MPDPYRARRKSGPAAHADECCGKDDGYPRPAPALHRPDRLPTAAAHWHRPKPERNRRNYDEGVYQPDYSDRERFAELEMIKKEAKQKRVADLLEKLLKTKEEDKLKELAKKPQKVADNNSISTIEYENTNSGINTFHGLYSQDKQKSIDKQIGDEFANFRAVVHANQEIISGGRVQIRLLESLIIKGKTIPKGTIIYGVAIIISSCVPFKKK